MMKNQRREKIGSNIMRGRENYETINWYEKKGNEKKNQNLKKNQRKKERDEALK